MLFGTDLNRRLDNIEDKLNTLQQQYINVKSSETEISEKLRYISSIIENDRDRDELSKDAVAKLLQQMSDKLNSIEKDILNNANKIESETTRNREIALEYVERHYARKEDLCNGLNSLRNQAKYIWYTISACVILIGWIINMIIQFYK